MARIMEQETQQTTLPPTEAPVANLPTVTRETRMIVHDSSSFANLLDTGKFEHMWRVAGIFASSGMVPKTFKGKREDCFVAIQMALRLEVDPFMFLQNTYPSPDGKPSMEGKLAIALINARGPFKGGIDYRFGGKGDDYGCTAFGVHNGDGKERSLTVTIKMAKDEGWYGRNKKWQTMPDQMLRYRSGAWFARAYCPEVIMGMRTREEAEDIGVLRETATGEYISTIETTPQPVSRQSIDAAKSLGAAIDAETGEVTEQPSLLGDENAGQ